MKARKATCQQRTRTVFFFFKDAFLFDVSLLRTCLYVHYMCVVTDTRRGIGSSRVTASCELPCERLKQTPGLAEQEFS